jgi:adenylate cyclase
MTTRRLAAILAADVVGFSAMMEKDEEEALQRVKALQREVIEPRVKARGGRLVKTTGDGFLCEFGSPVEAVRCALEVREAAAHLNGAADQPLLLRMGINLGDIIIEPDGDIYGDGVNVAARLEQLAEPGGVCISGSVHEHAEGKVGVRFESRGEQHVKNIDRLVRVYALAGAAQKVSEPKVVNRSGKLSRSRDS